MKKLFLLLLLTFICVGANAQYKVSLSINSVEIRDLENVLIYNIKNLTSISIKNPSTGNAGVVSFYYEGTKLDLNYSLVSLVSVSGGAYASPASFNSFIVQLNLLLTNPFVDIQGASITIDQQKIKKTYRIAFALTASATPTDVFQLIGSSTANVEITKIIISGTMTSGGLADVYISKRSTPNTGGTSSLSTNIPMVSTDPSATAVGKIYTANPTIGTSIGNIYVESMSLASLSDKINNIVSVDFGERGKPIILKGINEALSINFNGATIVGLKLKITVEFLEY